MSQYNQNLSENIVSALIYFFKSLVYILFICPFEFWAAATNRLANDRKNCRLDILKNTSRWPYLSFCKKVIFEFSIDGFIFISYFLGALAALIALIYCTVEGQFLWGLGAFFLVLIGTYYSPLGFSLFRDLLTLSLLPFYKFISWVSKPAQQLDIDMRKHGAAPAEQAAAPAQQPHHAQAQYTQPAPAAKKEAAQTFTIDPTWKGFVGNEFNVTHRQANGQVEAFKAPFQTFELTANGVFDGTFLGATRFETVNGALRLYNGSRYLGDFTLVNPNNNGLVEIADTNGIHYYLYAGK